MTLTKAQIKDTIEAVRVIADVIRSLGSVPSGVLYANVMPHMDLQTYESIVHTLKNCELVREAGNVLIWTGPKPEEKK